MQTANRRMVNDRRKENRRGPKSKNTRGMFDRRDYHDRRQQSRRMEDKEEQIENDLDKIFNDQVEGRNAVIELLESGKDINKIYITKGEKVGSINKIKAMAIENKVVLVEKDKKQMDLMAQTDNYQGVIAIVPPFEYCEIEEILEEANNKNEKAFILILDGIEDTHNLGAIIRTAEAAGVHGIIIPKRRAASVNSTVVKVSCGAAEHIKIARVNNINDTIKKLKEYGVWIIGTTLDSENLYFKQDLKDSIAIVIGNEQKGISELTKKNCDFIIKIPMVGHIQSLNASVSSGIIIYEALKQRKF